MNIRLLLKSRFFAATVSNFLNNCTNIGLILLPIYLSWESSLVLCIFGTSLSKLLALLDSGRTPSHHELQIFQGSELDKKCFSVW